MPICLLTDRLEFPDPRRLPGDAPIALGGDLSPERILLAYSSGIFPWYSEDLPVLWWSPDPRLVITPSSLKVSRSLRQKIRKNIFEITIDRDFARVIRACALVHTIDDGDTWITSDMEDAYIRLHALGHAHSVECWQGGKLAGGLYGVAIGRVFFGESMFARETDASKVAFVHLVERLRAWGYELIDCQVTTPHLMSLGAHEMPRDEFLRITRDLCGQSVSPEAWR